MMRVLTLASIFVLILAVGASLAASLYLQSIEEEEGSLETVKVEIVRAEQADIYARGYEKWGLLGKKISIEAEATNKADERLECIFVFTARDVFGNPLATCEKRWRFEPGDEMQFSCVLRVKDARKFYGVTYKVLPRTPPDQSEP